MNGLSVSELCCLFCCPPCPSRIAAKLAFLPPEPTYALLPDLEAGLVSTGSTTGSSLRSRGGVDGGGTGGGVGGGGGVRGGGGPAAGEGRWKLHLTERAEFQYSQRELDVTEVFLTRSSRGNRVGCMYIRCAPTARSDTLHYQLFLLAVLKRYFTKMLSLHGLRRPDHGKQFSFLNQNAFLLCFLNQNALVFLFWKRKAGLKIQ